MQLFCSNKGVLKIGVLSPRKPLLHVLRLLQLSCLNGQIPFRNPLKSIPTVPPLILSRKISPNGIIKNDRVQIKTFSGEKGKKATHGRTTWFMLGTGQYGAGKKRGMGSAITTRQKLAQSLKKVVGFQVRQTVPLQENRNQRFFFGGGVKQRSSSA